MPPIAGLQLICPERLDALGEQQRARTHARGGQRRLGAGVAAADDDHVDSCGAKRIRLAYRRRGALEPQRAAPVKT